MTALEAIADAVWIADGPDVDFHGFPYPTRMVIVRRAQETLWVWSPIRLQPELADAVTRIGTVVDLISPNKLHHLFLSEWVQRFPHARLWGPASTIAKRPDLDFAPALTDEPPAAWRGDFDQAWFRGSPFLDEVVFLHKASRTAIFADLVQAFGESYLQTRSTPWQRALARLGGITLSAGAHAPLDWRLSFFDRQGARTARAKVLGWNAERVVMAHGEWCRRDAATFLARSLAWLG